MTVTWYPRNILLGLVLLLAFAAVLGLAVDVQRGVAIGIGAVVVYAIVELVLSVNPATWQRRGRSRD